MSRHWLANVVTLTALVDVMTLVVDIATLHFSLLSLDVDVATFI